MACIVAIGGGGFLMEAVPSPVDDYLLSLSEKPRPKICFIPTPSGDSEEHLEKFYAAFNPRDCIPSHLAFFRKPRPNALQLPSFSEQLLSQDIIFVGGGNTKSALAVWREWGLNPILGQAWSKGIILSGMSAGALCWFEVGVSDSFGDGSYRPLPGLGFLPGACAAHYDGSPERRSMLHEAVGAKAIPDSVAIDEFAAIVFRERRAERVVVWRSGRNAYRVWDNAGTVREETFDSERI